MIYTIQLEVTMVTEDIYNSSRLKLIKDVESCNGHRDVTLAGEYNDLKRFVMGEHYGETLEFFENYSSPH
tara:strand:+ start:531 stop:740 length:210 start_codon:yes stop_codon:yes gene_type:complete